MQLSIIVPCYKEEQDIAKNMEKVHNFLLENKIDAEIICVSDGSPDKTYDIIKAIPYVKGIGYEVNRGKGGAVKFGIEHAQGEYIVFMDADLSTDLEALNDLQQFMGQFDLIIGSRHAKGSVIKIRQPFKRRFIGRMCRMIVNAKFKFQLKDTQCGFKAIKLEKAKEIIKRQQINGFAFDVEYLYIAKLLGMSMIELPVTWCDDRTSTVSPLKSSIRFFKDLKIIKKHKKDYLA